MPTAESRVKSLAFLNLVYDSVNAVKRKHLTDQEFLGKLTADPTPTSTQLRRWRVYTGVEVSFCQLERTATGEIRFTNDNIPPLTAVLGINDQGKLVATRVFHRSGGAELAISDRDTGEHMVRILKDDHRLPIRVTHQPGLSGM